MSRLPHWLREICLHNAGFFSVFPTKTSHKHTHLCRYHKCWHQLNSLNSYCTKAKRGLKRTPWGHSQPVVLFHTNKQRETRRRSVSVTCTCKANRGHAHSHSNTLTLKNPSQRSDVDTNIISGCAFGYRQKGRSAFRVS